jgi:hypothetical protein
METRKRIKVYLTVLKDDFKLTLPLQNQGGSVTVLKVHGRGSDHNHSLFQKMKPG